MGNFYVEDQEYNVFPASYDMHALNEKALNQKNIEIEGKKYKLLKSAPRPNINFGKDGWKFFYSICSNVQLPLLIIFKMYVQYSFLSVTRRSKF